MTIKSCVVAGFCAGVMAIYAPWSVLAGEVTGSGANVDQNQGKSWCSFSGKNDDPTAPLDGSGPNGPGGPAQSFGQENKLGLISPHDFNPGTACNPTRYTTPQPNRTH